MKKFVKQVLVGFTPKQVRWLTKEAKKIGIPRSELLRRMVDQQRELLESSRSSEAATA